MRLLAIGGTRFVGRHVVEQAVAAGHEVTVFHRGISEPEGLPPVEHVHGDRDTALDAVAGRTWDAVVDVCGYAPRVVRVAADALLGSVERYCFISTESVYAEPLPPVVTEASPLATLAGASGEWASYGPLKVLCERVVRTVFDERSLIVRPGYVVGPGDTTDRFTWWVRRSSLGGTMPAPGSGDAVFQFIDGRDLGAFVVRLLQDGAEGAFNADGEGLPLAAFLDVAARVTGGDARVVWIPEEELRTRHLEDAFPMWDEGAAHVRMDASKGRAAGLSNRPVEETIADTLAWDRARGLPPLEVGITAEREAALLAAHA